MKLKYESCDKSDYEKSGYVETEDVFENVETKDGFSGNVVDASNNLLLQENVKCKSEEVDEMDYHSPVTESSNRKDDGGGNKRRRDSYREGL